MALNGVPSMALICSLTTSLTDEILLSCVSPLTTVIFFSFRIVSTIKGHANEANEYPAMHYFRIPRHTQPMIAYKILTEFSGNSSEKLHCGNVVNMPYWIIAIFLSFRIVSTKPKLNVVDELFYVRFSGSQS